LDDTNSAGITNDQNNLGDPLSATTGMEFFFDADFLGVGQGHALRILPFITNFNGEFLSNQFLPGVNRANNLGGAGFDSNGNADNSPLVDSRGFGDQFYATVFEPTYSPGGVNTNWSNSGNWANGNVPLAAESTARIDGASKT